MSGHAAPALCSAGSLPDLALRFSPAVADSRWARALCVGCSWYKKKPTDDITFNTGNTAGTYHEQRLFLAAGRERSTRLLGGGLFGGKNQVLAGKYGNKKADTAA